MPTRRAKATRLACSHARPCLLAEAGEGWGGRGGQKACAHVWYTERGKGLWVWVSGRCRVSGPPLGAVEEERDHLTPHDLHAVGGPTALHGAARTAKRKSAPQRTAPASALPLCLPLPLSSAATAGLRGVEPRGDRVPSPLNGSPWDTKRMPPLGTSPIRRISRPACTAVRHAAPRHSAVRQYKTSALPKESCARPARAPHRTAPREKPCSVQQRKRARGNFQQSA